MAKICRTNRLRFVYCSTVYTLNAWCVRQSLLWAQCTHVQLNHFYHPFYPDVTHVRKDTRPSPALPYWKRWKAGRGLGTRLWSHHSAPTVK